ncbi:MAG: class I SAM-dependent methyltransferase [Pseudomonadota bacterium]
MNTQNPSSTVGQKDAAFWDRMSSRYAKAKIGDEEGYARTLERTRSLLTEEDSVLELGCGTGITALRLATAAGRYLATDIAAGMIAQANQRLQDEPTPGLEFQVGTAESMAASDNTFTTVLGFNYLHLVSDLNATLKHIHHLTAPGGRFISKTPCLADSTWLIRVLVAVLRLVRFAPPSLLFFTERELCHALEAAGFTIEAVERHRSKKSESDKRPYIVARKS